MGQSSVRRLEFKDINGGSQTFVPFTTPHDTYTSFSSVTSHTGKKGCFVGRISPVSSKKGLRKSRRWRTCLLRSLIHCPQKVRRLETGDRLEDFKRACEMPNVQDGIRLEGQEPTESRRVVGFSGLVGRIPACPGTPRFPQVHESSHSRTDLAVQSHVLRALHSPSYLYQTPSACSSLSSGERGDNSSLFRRLVDSSTHISPGSCGHKDSRGDADSAGLDSQLQEVRATPCSTASFSGYGYRPSFRPVTAHQGEVTQSPGLGTLPPFRTSNNCPPISITSRPAQCG